MQLSIWILLGINLLTFIIYGIDKLKARHGHWRTPEWVLLLLAAACGSLGALLAMYLFHHKTRKAKFYLLVPLMLIIQLFGIWYLTQVSHVPNYLKTCLFYACNTL